MNRINKIFLKILFILILSFGIMKPDIYAQESNFKANISTALKTITTKWEYQLGDFANVKYIADNKLTENCNDERCVTFCIIDNYLIASYRVKEVIEYGTVIISLSNYKYLVQDLKTVFYVQKADI